MCLWYHYMIEVNIVCQLIFTYTIKGKVWQLFGIKVKLYVKTHTILKGFVTTTRFCWILWLKLQISPGFLWFRIFLACNNKPADVFFMVDKSSSLGSQANFDKELSFIARFVEGFNIGQGPKDVRVGVISFSTEAKLEFGLASYGDKRSLQNALLGIEFSLGNTYTHKAFDILLNRGFSASKRPSTVPRIGKNLPISRCQWVNYPVSIYTVVEWTKIRVILNER